MQPNFLTDEELARIVREKAEDPDWIVVQGNPSESFCEFCRLVENRFYPPGTPRNAGFEIVFPTFTVFLRKKELSEDVIEFLENRIDEQGGS